MLTLINDNIDGFQGALSIQNVARMSLVFERYPGEWHGNKSISLVFSHLMKVYNPIKNFKICLFGDENVFFDKIEKACYRPQVNWLQKQNDNFDSLSVERQENLKMIEALFKDYLNEASLVGKSDLVDHRAAEYTQAL